VTSAALPVILGELRRGKVMRSWEADEQW